LSIAQWIASAHGGTIQIESTPSQLTAVIVRLPLHAGGLSSGDPAASVFPAKNSQR
jgi:signal transduction histidine kinase